MNIGSLYKVKNSFWMLFPTKTTASVGAHVHFRALTSKTATAYWSSQYNCKVTSFSPDSFVVCLEEDGKLKKFLTSEGLIGWTWLGESYNKYFEEVKSE